MTGRSALLFLVALAAPASAISLVVDPPAVPVGGLAVVHADAADARGTFEGKRLAFFPGGHGVVALVGIDLDHPPGRFALRVESAKSGAATVLLEVLAKQFPEERLTVPKTYTELDPATLRRVGREQKLLASLWPKSGPERLWEGAFVKPADGPPGSPFGLRRFFNGEPRSPHAGVDFRAPAGAPVAASNRGKVVLARELFFTGNTVVLDHGLGVFTLYVHLSELEAAPGRIVEKGAEIGKVGATGRVTGPHLHFAARVGDARIDPLSLLERALD
jgi:murein DD-endopeptidase MepM/ murein hydrolase activator NlpD